MYERSYMHKDIVSHILLSQRNKYIITTSNDGVVKFWKKAFRLIEFIKSFKAHMGNNNFFLII